METIKNYLESMFRNLPNTSEVLKAKNELLQMMEDKYAELRREGKSENEAVATVISEFGNLDEVASSLGIKEVLGNNKEEQARRNVTLDEVKEYLADLFNSIVFKVVGIVLFITCTVPVMLFGDVFEKYETMGVVLMFVLIAAGIACMIIPRANMETWRFLRHELCSISPATTDYVSNEKKKFRNTYTIMNTVGIVLCVCSFIPAIILDEKSDVSDSWSGILFFVFVAAGVACIVYSSWRYRAYQRLLNINSESTIGGTYTRARDKEPYYDNKTMRAIMSVYWPTVTCIYLAYSFLTFHWWISWIIWPIAGVVHKLIINLNSED